jgi:uncharacterized damage-inducible protein DinB
MLIRMTCRPLTRGALALVLVGPFLAVAGSAHAQGPRDAMLRDWERNRDAVLAFARAMPEEHLSFRPTPEVRTYAEQIEHIVRDNVQILAMAFARDVPELGERDRYLARSDALAAHAEAGYAWVLEVIRGLTDDELRAPVTLFGRVRMPGWRALEAAREHATWTLGQTIPYLRLNGVQPPPYPMFHSTEMTPGS